MIRIDEIRALHHDLHLRPIQGRPARVPHPRRRPDERRGGHSPPQGSREAPRLRDDRTGRERGGRLPRRSAPAQLVPFRRLSRLRSRNGSPPGPPSPTAAEVAVVARLAGRTARPRAPQLDDEAHAAATRARCGAERLRGRGLRSGGGRRRDPRRRSRSARRPDAASRSSSTGWSCRAGSGAGGQACEFGAEKSEVLAALDDLGGDGTSTSSWRRTARKKPSPMWTAVRATRRRSRARDGGRGGRPRHPAGVARDQELNLNLPLFLKALFVRLRRAFS